MQKVLEITVLTGVSAGDIFRFDFSKNSSVVIGRASESDLVLQDPSVSRKHAKVELRPDGFYLGDFGSSQGTFLMGFQLVPGDENAKRLSKEDEFKIGDALFRVQFDDGLFEKPKEKKVEAKKNASSSSERKGLLKNKKLVILGGLCLVLVLSLLLFPQKKKAGAGKQLGHVILNMPQERVLGYWVASKRKEARDTTHLDQAQFYLPAADLVIEFEYRSQVPVEVRIDDVLIERLEPQNDIWQPKIILARDILSGQDRKLVFDNIEFPYTKGKSPAKHKEWAIRNVRSTPLSRTNDQNLLSQLNTAVAIVGRLDKAPDSLYRVIRELERSMIEILSVSGSDATLLGIDLESTYPSELEVSQALRAIIDEQNAGSSAEANDRHLKVLSGLLSRLEGELWRRYNSRLNQALFAAKTKEAIVAHDNLFAIRQMFPDEADYRWLVADRYYNNNKIVPKKVRAQPGKFRR